ncbi:MAG TPA: hypothetical protein VG847_13915 [Chitinophagaceae bacterium]|nr:hypothetical protein [Chitinophagaceae bacterium]
MLIAIPYKNFPGPELRYCLRSIEKFIDEPEILIIGDKPEWLQNVRHIPFQDNKELQFKERNIFQKLLLIKEDFLFFNDDHFLLTHFDPSVYHYSGSLSGRIKSYLPANDVRKTVENTLKIFGDIDNYYRHGPIFCRYDIIVKLKTLDWNKPWGYCIKSAHCFLADIKGTQYSDLKIRQMCSFADIKKITEDREYFSTGDNAMGEGMKAFLEFTYPDKSRFEK